MQVFFFIFLQVGCAMSADNSHATSQSVAGAAGRGGCMGRVSTGEGSL